MLRYLLLLSIAVLLAACSGGTTDPSDPIDDTGPMASKDLIYKKGDTLVFLVEDLSNGSKFNDSMVLANIDEHDNYNAWVWRRLGSTELVTDWIDSGYIRSTETYWGYLGTFGRIPSSAGELLLIDTVKGKPWEVERLSTVTPDTSITTLAGTFRCAVFQCVMTTDDDVRYKIWYAYSPGNGEITCTFSSIVNLGGSAEYRYKRTLIKRMFAR